MDALCLKAGIHDMVSPSISAAGNGGLRPSISAAQTRQSDWGFTFRHHPLRSLWRPGVKNWCEPAISVDDGVIIKQCEEEEGESRNENWVFKILHVRSLWRDDGKKYGESLEENKQEESAGVELEEQVKSCGGEDDECDVCTVDDEDENIKFDTESFSKLLKKVPLAEARLYAQMSFLGVLAYSIPEIKPGNLLRYHGLRFVTSSIDKKKLASKAEKEKESAAESDDVNLKGNNKTERVERVERKTNGNHRLKSSSAYQIAASYLHSHTKSVLRFKSSKPDSFEINSPKETNGDMDRNMASLMATTDSVTAVVAAKEEVKQAVADDLNSTRSSPCEWFACDDDLSATRFFVIQGSESLASWQANLLFEPVRFEGLDFLVHRGIYEAAKGMYEQMLPEINEHLKSHGERATFRFTGHSLGGSLSLLVSLMLLIRGEAPRSSLLPIVTFGAPSVMCGGDRLLRELGLPRRHIRSVAMHRDIVPRAFSCNYPKRVAEFLKAVNRNFRNHPCLNKQKLLYAPMGEFLILQPDEKFSPRHDLLPSGSGLYVMACPELDAAEEEKRIRAAQAAFMNSPHPLETLSDRTAYGYRGTIMRDHDMNSYLKSVRDFVRRELIRIRKAKREHRRRVENRFIDFSGIVRTGRESWKRFSTMVKSQHMQLLVVLLLPARLLVGLIKM